MNVIARAVAFVEVAVTAEMEQIELVDQAVALEQINRAVDGYAGDVGIDLLRAVQNFASIEMTPGGFHHLHEDAALAGEANAARSELPLKVAGRLVSVYSLAGGYAVC